MTKLKENMIAFAGAILLTLGVILFINSGTSRLATNILGSKKNVQSNLDTDVIYNSGSLSLISLKNVNNVASVSLELLFNSSKIKISQNNIDSLYNISSAKKEGGNGYDIILSNIGSIRANSKLLTINDITKKQYGNINIGHIQLIDNNGRVLNLSNEKK